MCISYGHGGKDYVMETAQTIEKKKMYLGLCIRNANA